MSRKEWFAEVLAGFCVVFMPVALLFLGTALGLG